MSTDGIERFRERARRAESDPRYVAEMLRLAFAEGVVRMLEARGMKRTELAEALGTNRGYVTRVLSTEYNLTLETMARIALALGANVSLHVAPREAVTQWTEFRAEEFAPPPASSCWRGRCVQVDPPAARGGRSERAEYSLAG
jgi:transcriptional regulator with XRE-family HTH domain